MMHMTALITANRSGSITSSIMITKRSMPILRTVVKTPLLTTINVALANELTAVMKRLNSVSKTSLRTVQAT